MKPHGLQYPVVADEGAEDLALVGQKGHPLVDVVVRFDRDIRRSVADAPLRRALLEHSVANPCRRIRIERAFEHAEAVFAQVRLEPVHLAGEPRSTRHQAFTNSRHRVKSPRSFPTSIDTRAWCAWPWCMALQCSSRMPGKRYSPTRRYSTIRLLPVSAIHRRSPATSAPSG